MASDIPSGFRYSKDHEWVHLEDGIATVGITDYAQEALGDIVFVDLPEVGTKLERKGELAVVESVKAASEVYAPLSGEVTAVNEALEDAPETLNDSPYKKGWIAKLEIDDESEMDKLMTAAQYEQYLEDS